jgi:hypothetical protein
MPAAIASAAATVAVQRNGQAALQKGQQFFT